MAFTAYVKALTRSHIIVPAEAFSVETKGFLVFEIGLRTTYSEDGSQSNGVGTTALL